jgi:hypothetical protein
MCTVHCQLHACIVIIYRNLVTCDMCVETFTFSYAKCLNFHQFPFRLNFIDTRKRLQIQVQVFLVYSTRYTFFWISVDTDLNIRFGIRNTSRRAALWTVTTGTVFIDVP